MKRKTSEEASMTKDKPLIDPAVLARLEAVARQRGLPVAGLINEVLTKHLELEDHCDAIFARHAAAEGRPRLAA
jgi:hypothetical protein